MMKIEGVRRARCCFQHRYAVAPIVAEHFALREVVQARVTSEISARNFRLARDERKVAWHLRPKAGFVIQVLADRDKSEVGKV